MKNKEPLKVIVTNPPTEEQKRMMCKMVEDYFNGKEDEEVETG